MSDGKILKVVRCFIMPLLCIALSGSGCATFPGPPIFAIHEPIHPAATQPITFKATIDVPVTGQRVLLKYQHKTVDNRGISSSGESFQTMKECTIKNSKDNLCEYTLPNGFPDHSLIVFRAEYEIEKNKWLADEYAFAAGEYPVADGPIPIRERGKRQKYYNIAFIADNSLTNIRDRLKYLMETYMKYDIYKSARVIYNYYYFRNAGEFRSYYDADGKFKCRFKLPPSKEDYDDTVDANMIVFEEYDSTRVRGCRVQNKAGISLLEKTIIHESGHTLFNLKDEYSGDTGYKQQSCFPNLWSTLEECQSYAPSIQMTPEDCTEVKDVKHGRSWWRIDPTGDTGCIMGESQRKKESNYGPACLARITYRHKRCLKGNCHLSKADNDCRGW